MVLVPGHEPHFQALLPELQSPFHRCQAGTVAAVLHIPVPLVQEHGVVPEDLGCLSCMHEFPSSRIGCLLVVPGRAVIQ